MLTEHCTFLIAFIPFHSNQSFTGHPIQLQIVNVQVEWSLLIPNLSILTEYIHNRHYSNRTVDPIKWLVFVNPIMWKAAPLIIFK